MSAEQVPPQTSQPSPPPAEAENPNQNVIRLSDDAKRMPEFLRVLVGLLEWLQAWFALLNEIFPGRAGKKKARPWHLRFGKQARRKPLSQEEVNRLLQKHRDLKDVEKIAGIAAGFRLPESDFLADPQNVERLIRRILEENPPWLYVSRVLTGGEPGADAHSQEFLWREQEIRELQEVTLFVPDDTWRDKPLSSRTLRQARNLNEVWQARLLDQILPPEVLVDRCNRGEIMIPNRHVTRQRLEFKSEQRRIEVTIRKPVPIPIDMEGGSGKGGQLLYILLDYSASMQGKSATLALAVIASVIRANMGQARTRYLFRRYADWEEMWPRIVEPPVQARTLEEKDCLLDTICATNFNGGATHVNDALQVAVKDIEHLRRTEHLDAMLLLVTDGRAEILEGTQKRLREAKVKIHTVMVTPEANPGLLEISDSFTALDISPDRPLAEGFALPLPHSQSHRAQV